MQSSLTKGDSRRLDQTGFHDASGSWSRGAALWNWKSAVLSMMLRVPVFAVAAVRRGPEAIAAATLAEAVVCGFNAGCYAAVIQALRNRKPVWLTALVITAVLPAAGQVIEYEVHTWRGTPHRTVAVIISTILGVLASLFNWYAMKRGSLLVGGKGSSFSSDLRQIPLLLLRFLLLGPRWLLRRAGWVALPPARAARSGD
jgi:hypothetical protein